LKRAVLDGVPDSEAAFWTRLAALGVHSARGASMRKGPKRRAAIGARS
jgi:hypothetical protein